MLTGLLILAQIFSICFNVVSSEDAAKTSATSAAKASTNSSTATSKDMFSKPLATGSWRKRKIICLFNSQYYYRTKFSPSMIDPKLCTHINYEFAFLDNTNHHIIIGDPKLDVQEHFYEQVTSLKQKNPFLKVLLSMGGWIDSTEKYSILVGDPAKRESFVQHVIPFLRQHNFDGLDVAWEYPNAWQGKIGVSPQDRDNFSLFLQLLRREFDKENLQLSVSVASVKQEIEAAYDVKAVSDAVDHINVMAFDLHGPWEHKTGHHAQFAKRPNDDNTLNLEESLKLWVLGGADKIKLMVGIPAYGKSFTLAYPRLNSMGSPTHGVGRAGPSTQLPGYLSYSEICENVLMGNWTEVEDPQAGPYAYKDDQWVSYDSLRQVVRKVKFSIDHGFGGILFKDVSGDDFTSRCYKVTFPLLRTIQMEMVKREILDHLE